MKTIFGKGKQLPRKVQEVASRPSFKQWGISPTRGAADVIFFLWNVGFPYTETKHAHFCGSFLVDNSCLGSGNLLPREKRLVDTCWAMTDDYIALGFLEEARGNLFGR